jgi:hypothetical protein
MPTVTQTIEEQVEGMAAMLRDGILSGRDVETDNDRPGIIRLHYRVVSTLRGTIWLTPSKDRQRVYIRALRPR